MLNSLDDILRFDGVAEVLPAGGVIKWLLGMEDSQLVGIVAVQQFEEGGEGGVYGVGVVSEKAIGGACPFRSFDGGVVGGVCGGLETSANEGGAAIISTWPGYLTMANTEIQLSGMRQQ